MYLGRQQFAQCAVLFAQTQGLRIDRRLIIEIRIAVVLRSEWIGGRGGHGLKNIDTKAERGNYEWAKGVSKKREGGKKPPSKFASVDLGFFLSNLVDVSDAPRAAAGSPN